MQARWKALFSTLAVALFGCGDDVGDEPGGSGSGSAQAGSGDGNGGIGGDDFAGGARCTPAPDAGECGWEGCDPGDLAGTGTAVGSVIANVTGLVDQCGATRSLWDFAGGYRIVVLAEGW